MDRTCVTADPAAGVGVDGAHVVGTHRVVDDLDRGPGQERVEDELGLAAAGVVDRVVQAYPLVTGEGARSRHLTDRQVTQVGHHLRAAPTPGEALLDPRQDAGTEVGGEVVAQRQQVVAAGPLRQVGPQARTAGRVGVGVQAHVGATVDGLVDHGQGLLHRAPVAPPLRLVVAELDRDACLPPDPQRLVDGTDQPIVLTTDVGGVEAAVPLQLRRERDELLGVGEPARVVDQPGRHAERSLRQSLGEQSRHPIEVSRTGRATRVRHGGGAEGAVADHGSEVDAQGQLPGGAHEGVEVGRSVAVPTREGAESAVPGDEGGGALAEHPVGPRELVDDEVDVAVQVDEAGAHDPPGRVDGAFGLDPVRITDHTDAITPDHHVGDETVAATPVDHSGAADHDRGCAALGIVGQHGWHGPDGIVGIDLSQ